MRFAFALAVGLVLTVAVGLRGALAKDAPATSASAAPPTAPPAPAAPPKAEASAAADVAKPVVDPPERAIEKSNGDFIYKVTFRPGNLKPNRVADMRVQLFRALESPDPVNGDREPLAGSQPVASVQLTVPPTAKGHKAIEPPPAIRYVLWPEGDPGNFVFHFTPKDDGLYQLTIAGTAKASEDGDAAPFSTTFRIGVGTAAADTELSQGETPRHARLSADAEDDGLSTIQRAMRQIGQRYLDLDEMVNHPSKGSHSDAAAEARAIADLFAQVKGQVPSERSGDAAEFNTLADSARERVDGVANSVDGHDPAGARAGLAKLQLQSCDQCHAKFWYDVTDDLSAWPSFHQKAAKAAAE